MLGVSAAARTLSEKRVVRGEGRNLLQAQAHLGLPVTTPRATCSSCRFHRRRRESRAQARMPWLPHEWEHSVGEKGPQSRAASRVPPPSSWARHHRGSHRRFVSGSIVASANKPLYMSDFRNLG